MGDSDTIQVGEPAIAIGNPLGMELRGSVTVGIVSALNRQITVGDNKYTLIQTDAAINPGNSGGALVNADGELMGINSAKYAGNGVEGIGFAIPTTTVKTVADQLLAEGPTKDRPCLGIYVYEVEAEEDHPGGLLVDSVEAEADAARQGLQAGDIVTAINGETITDFDLVQDTLNAMDIGDTVTLTIWRDGTQLERTVKLMSYNELYGIN